MQMLIEKRDPQLKSCSSQLDKAIFDVWTSRIRVVSQSEKIRIYHIAENCLKEQEMICLLPLMSLIGALKKKLLFRYK